MRPLEAQRWLVRLEAAAARLELFPWSGHPVPEVPRLSARQTFVLPYRLIYFIGDEEVTITTVCHTRESLTEHPEAYAAETSRRAATPVIFPADIGGIDAEADRF